MTRPRETRAFAAVTVACALFFILTIVAMLVYPGGRVGDIHSSGYAFFGVRTVSRIMAQR